MRRQISNLFKIDLKMEEVSLASIDEMWKVIENFGIKRKVFGKSNPSYQEIKELYLLIKSKKTSKGKIQQDVDLPS